MGELNGGMVGKCHGGQGVGHACYAYPDGEGLRENGLSSLICLEVDLVLIIPVIRTDSLHGNFSCMAKFER